MENNLPGQNQIPQVLQSIPPTPEPPIPQPNSYPVPPADQPQPPSGAVALAKATPSPPPKSGNKFLVIGLVILIVGLVASGIILIISQTKANPNDTTTNSDQSALIPAASIPAYSPFVFHLPSISPSPSRPGMAPPGTPEFHYQRYRDQKASIAEAQAVQKRIGPTFGSIIINDESIFVQSETYKNVAIKWTATQSVPADKLSWLKSTIDILPDYFIKDHPIDSIISVQASEVGLNISPSLLGAPAYASGFNIFLTSIFTKDQLLYQMDKKQTARTLFHEWMHVVQHYEILQTFSEDYLKIPGNLIVVMPLLPFNKDFAKTVGWEFVEDQYGDSTYAKLKDDPESQKTTDYGKTAYVEDIAETMSSFMLCDTTHLSQARIKWAETQTGKPASDFCPSKI